MRVKLSDDFFVKIYARNYTLIQLKTIKDKDGSNKTYEKIHGYHGTFDQAVEKFLRLSHDCVTDVESVKIQEYVKHIDESNKAAVQAFKEIMETMSDKDTSDTFKFDFSKVRSFDCPCGRRYINTAEIIMDDDLISRKEVIDELKAWEKASYNAGTQSKYAGLDGKASEYYKESRAYHRAIKIVESRKAGLNERENISYSKK